MQKKYCAKLIREIESELKDKKVKTSLFLIDKIKSIGDKNKVNQNIGLKNSFDFITQNMQLMPLEELRKEISAKILEYKEIAHSTNHIKNLSSKIKNGAVIFIYGNPETAIASAKLAKQNGIKFSIITSESGTNLAGRNAAEELSESGISVEHIPDFLTGEKMKNADLAIFEAHAALKDRVIADAGADVFTRTANQNKVPVYCTLDIFSVDRTGTLQEKDFADKKTRKQNITIINKTRSAVKNSEITAVVMQTGIIKP